MSDPVFTRDDDNAPITVRQFLEAVAKSGAFGFKGSSTDDIVGEMYDLDLTDSNEFLFPNLFIQRKRAAVIVHRMLIRFMKLSDIRDISPALGLADIYDCRTCLNSVAQVYMRGIMEAKGTTIRDGREVPVFGMNEFMTVGDMKKLTEITFIQIGL